MNNIQLIRDSVALNSTASTGLCKEPGMMLCTADNCLDVVERSCRMSQCFRHIGKARPETTYDTCADGGAERCRGSHNRRPR